LSIYKLEIQYTVSNPSKVCQTKSAPDAGDYPALMRWNGRRSPWTAPSPNLRHAFQAVEHFSLAWHYRNACGDSGYSSSRELIKDLEGCIEPFGLKILDGNMVVEVMHSKIGKGIAVGKLLNGRHYDFILSAGDDVTDEEIFDLLKPFDNAVTIKVGKAASCARYRFSSVGDTVSFLNKLKK